MCTCVRARQSVSCEVVTDTARCSQNAYSRSSFFCRRLLCMLFYVQKLSCMHLISAIDAINPFAFDDEARHCLPGDRHVTEFNSHRHSMRRAPERRKECVIMIPHYHCVRQSPSLLTFFMPFLRREIKSICKNRRLGRRAIA